MEKLPFIIGQLMHEILAGGNELVPADMLSRKILYQRLVKVRIRESRLLLPAFPVSVKKSGIILFCLMERTALSQYSLDIFSTKSPLMP